MAGHSKWKQIKHYKAAADAKRGALFTKLIREITVSAKAGGGDPDGNPRLRTAIEAARAASMPKDNIERAVKKGTGDLEGVSYSEITYEGFGPGGVAILVHTLTHNPTRTVADLGALGAPAQHADVVLGLFREELYPALQGAEGATELSILKNRNGPSGMYVDLYFYKQWLRFEDMAE